MKNLLPVGRNLSVCIYERMLCRDTRKKGKKHNQNSGKGACVKIMSMCLCVEWFFFCWMKKEFFGFSVELLTTIDRITLFFLGELWGISFFFLWRNSFEGSEKSSNFLLEEFFTIFAEFQQLKPFSRLFLWIKKSFLRLKIKKSFFKGQN